VLNQHTNNPQYAEQRKQVSSAFFKAKLLSMTTTIKRIVLKEIKRLQETK
jgi:cytochrome P450